MRILNTIPIGYFLLILSYLLPSSVTEAQVYVDRNAGGANDGSSWANAFRDLQTALTLTPSGQIWVARGTYKPIACNPCTTADQETAFRILPEVQLYGGFAGTESNLEQRDWKANLTVLSGDIGVVGDSLDNSFNVLIAVNSTENTVLDGFIIEEGNADGSFGFSAGGGLFMDANPGGTADMQVRNCTFRNNYAGGGGAMAIDCVLGGSSKALIRDCIFEQNTASLRVSSTGAAVFIQGNSGAQIHSRFVNCIFRDNYCGNDGGAFSATPTGENSLLAAVIDSCLFANNRADDRGGAVWYRMSSSGESRVMIKNSRFLGNRSGGQGGAIYARSSFDNVATDTLLNCLFSQNIADGTSTVNEGEGGAIFLRGSQDGTRDHQVINCVFDRNRATLRGGAVATSSAVSTPGVCQSKLVNCSFYGNSTAGRGGAIHAQDSTGTNVMRITNSIFHRDSAVIDGMELFRDRATVTLSHCNIAGGLPAGFMDGGNNTDLDPQFADPVNGDLHLLACSPLINIGSNAALPLIAATDLDGDTRIHAGTVDLGAYEIGVIYVDQSAQGANNGRSWANAFNRFEDGLAAAGAGDQIWVAQGTYLPVSCNPCTTTDLETAFRLVNHVEVYGGFSGNENQLAQRDWQTFSTILSGDIGIAGDSTDNVFNVLIAENSSDKTILDGFIIEEGNADGSFGFSAGGGIFIDANPGGIADLQIRNCTFRNNYAGGGGALAIDCVLGGSSKALIRDCIFERNTASLRVTSTGAAVFIQGNSGAQIRPRFVNCTFRNNYCGNDGGAFSATPTGENSLLAAVIDSCLFTNNRADDRGGAIWYRMSSFGESRVVIRNSRFIENLAGGEGGAIYARSSFDNVANDTIVNCLFSQNRADGSSTINDGEGGAIFIRGSQQATRHHEIINCVFDRNSATLLGGAVATTSIEAQAGICRTNLLNCTFAGNRTSGDGGAIHAEGSQGENTTIIGNTIFWNDQALINGPEIWSNGAVVNIAYSDIEGGVPPVVNDGGNNLEVDPQFVDAAVGDLHLGPCSPLIDQGENTLLPPDQPDLDGDGDLAEMIPFDLDGLERILQGTVDMGAYEFDGSEPPLSLNKNVVNESCDDACDGEVIVVPSGGQAGYTFAWSDGQASPRLENLCAGTYYVTINDASTCTLVDSVIIEAGEALELSVSPDAEVCPGQTADLSATASGGTGILAYSWDNDPEAGSEQMVSPQQTTTYSVTVTDFNGCSESGSTTVTVFVPPVAGIQGNTEICPDQTTILDAGVFSAYVWSTGGTDQQIEVSEAGTYALTVTDESGCTGTTQVEVVAADSIETSISGSSTFCAGSTTILAGEPGFASYQWSTGSTESSIEVSEAGSYTLTVTDAAGCSGSATIVAVASASLSPVISGNQSICPGASTILDAGLFAAYAWSTGATDQQIEVSEAGTYALTVTDESGCTGTTQVEVVAADSIETSISGSSTFCAGSTTILAGEPGFASYQWSTGSTESSIEVSEAGSYTLTVTDAAGCSGSATIVAVASASLSPVISGNQSICPGASTILDAGLFAAYAWSTGATDQQIEVSEAGTYALTVTDESGCTGTTQVEVVAADSIETSISGSSTFCAGSTTVLTGEPGFASYQWSTGSTESSIEVSEAGSYTLTVTDAAGCSGSATIVAVASASLSPVISGNQSICPGASTILDAGLFAAYAWSTGATDQQIEVSEAGTYALTVTDESGCTGTTQVEVVAADSIETSISGSSTFCAGSTTVLTGEPGFASYQWSTGSTELSIEVSEAGSYTLTVTNAAGCSGSATIVAVASASLSPVISGNQSICPGASTILDAGLFAAYAWSTGATDQQIEVSEAGTYALTVTDESGCTGTTQVEVVAADSIETSISGSSTFCAGSTTILAGEPGFASYQWSTGSTESSIEVSEAGSYTLTVTDAAGCSGSATIVVVASTSLSPVISGMTTFCPGDSTLLDAGDGYTSYLWSDGSAEQLITISVEGMYQVTVTDSTGCTGTTEVLITHDLPEVAMAGPDLSTCTDAVQLMGNQPPGTTGRWTSSDATVVFMDPSLANTTAGIFSDTMAVLTWTLSTTDCPEYSFDELVVFSGQGPVAVPDVGFITDPNNPSLSLDLLANDMFFGITDPMVRLLSEPALGSIDSLVDGIVTYTAPENGTGSGVFTYELCVAGCPCSTATVTITIEAGNEEEATLANTITPNGDGFNETFVFDIIRTTPPEEQPDNELTIFNRWGDIVFHQEDYDNSWNGVNSRGEALPQATYYYILRLNIGEGVIIRGDVTIIR